MAEVVLFHHVMGLTAGVQAFADRLAAGGHVVHTPDLYGGQTAHSLEDGFVLKNAIGDETLDRRVADALADLPAALVYAGISLGVMTAQRLAQTRPGARGALLYAACVPVTGEWAFGPWPEGVQVQVHGMDDDEFFAHEGDLEAARGLVAAAGPEVAELFTYPGDAHLFLDSSLPDHDPDATALVVARSLDLLDRVG